MKTILLCLLLMFTAARTLAHNVCADHRVTGSLGQLLEMKDTVIQGEYDGAVFAVAIPAENFWEGGPSDGFKVPIYLQTTANSPHCLVGVNLTIEYDKTLFTIEDVRKVNLWPSTRVTWNLPVQTTFCTVSDNLAHEKGAIAIYSLNIGPPGVHCLPEGVVVHAFDIYIRAPGINSVSWQGWDTSASFDFSCAVTGQNGPTLGIAYQLHDTVGWDCEQQWGDPGLVPKAGCWVFDLHDETAGGTGLNAYFCSISTVGNTCISCPACNYFGECFDPSGYCETHPNDPDCQVVEKPIAPATWQRVKQLYRE